MSLILGIILIALFGAAVITLLIWLAVHFILKRVMSRVATNAHQQVSERFADQDIIMSTYQANCFGVESAGPLQIRGNGALVLTANELYFVGAAGREIAISRDSIIGVSDVRSHLRKTVFKPLLHVRYRTASGEDSAAWLVPDLARWKTALDSNTGLHPGPNPGMAPKEE